MLKSLLLKNGQRVWLLRWAMIGQMREFVEWLRLRVS